MATVAISCDNSYMTIETLIRLLIRDADCEPVVDCDTREDWQALVKQLFSVLADGTMALNVCACDTQPT
jgi:hypothetical protein